MSHTRIKSIKTKIIILALIITTMVTLTMIVISNMLSVSNLNSLINENWQRNIKGYSDTIGNWIQERKTEMNVYSNIPIMKTMDWRDIYPYLKRETDENKSVYNFLFIADKNGKYHTVTGGLSGSIFGREYFKKVMEGSTVVSEPLISKTGNQRVIVVASPIKDNNDEIIGLVGGTINLIRLYDFIERFNTNNPSFEFFIINKEGFMITHKDKSMIMTTNINEQSLGVKTNNDFTDILVNKEGVIGRNFKATDKIYYFSEIPNTDGWKVIAKIPKSYFMSPVNKASRKLIFIGFIGIVIGVVLAFILSRKISRPIENLKKVFDKASEGDLTARANIETNDEIGEASKGFNKMMDTIEYMTYNDELTGMYNMNFLIKRLSHIISNNTINDTQLAVIVIGLDKFKQVNDTLGHNIGDKLLKRVSSQLNKIIKYEYDICRIGGDEFAIILHNIENEQYVSSLADEILNKINVPWIINKYNLYITASIGIAFYSKGEKDANVILKNANMAMHKAKEKGGGRLEFYVESMDKELIEQMNLENNMRNGLKNNEFFLRYQPIIDINTKRIVGMEALVRWKHPSRGIVSPAEFIPLAEENGFIVELSKWILTEACVRNKELQDEGYDPIYVSVNISPVQMQEPNFVNTVFSILEETKLDPKYLELEITESVFIGNLDYTVEMLNKLKEMGISIALDDFGTGYSSLSYLHKLPFDTMKIDQSFVKDLDNDKSDKTIVSTIIDIGENLNISVTAEGVETIKQLRFLKDQRCYSIQGYYFSPPVSSDEFKRLMNRY